MQTPIYLFATSPYEGTIHINSLDFEFFQPKIDFSSYDFFIITSKQIASVFKHFHITPPHNKALCVSSKTALAYQKIGGEILAIGNGYGDYLFEMIQQYPKEKRWLYLRAKEVASHFVQKAKEAGYKIDEIILYESRCSSKILQANIPKKAILIFTSPSSIQCFLQNHHFSLEHKVIVIGKTTAKALPKNIEYVVAKKTTIKSAVDLAITFI
ncbi:Uroporphyrinogen-III synthase [hydrothermal vent metagenome]|uniref:Uroporphyrinogen-III synthase n=1 Tax=hydrothermal vent metagenome TaxID=652676 RepID=A0A1W1D250_9ZZZZ